MRASNRFLNRGLLLLCGLLLAVLVNLYVKNYATTRKA